MVRTASTMLPLGTQAPHFSLPGTEGEAVSLDDFRESSGLLVVFLCNHCPFVKHIRDGLAAFGRDYMPRGLGVVAISSNDVERYPADSPEQMAREKAEAGYPFPYLFDESQDVALAYRASCTPDFFLFDEDLRLVYRGQFDGSRPGNGVPVTGEDLRGAADALLSGDPIPETQIPSVGCNIKWKPGREPDWFGA